MFGIDPKCPVSSEGGYWIEATLRRFEEIFGSESLKSTRVVLPTPEFFPDEGDTPTERVNAFFQRVCSQMQIDPGCIDLCFFEDETEELHNSLKHSLPEWEGSHSGAAGFYSKQAEQERTIIAVKQKQLADPVSLIATLAHEVGHELLLGGGHVKRDAPDMEPQTDLITVFRGLGIFTANSAFNFSQYTDGSRAGWSVRRQGYLSEAMFGYALAYFAKLREEAKPAWVRHLKPNVAHYFKQSARFLGRRR